MATPARPYDDPRQHLEELLVRVRFLLKRYHERHKERYTESPVGGLHTFVTVFEMEAILAQTAGAEALDPAGLELLDDRLRARAEATQAAGRELPLALLAKRLALDAAGVDLVLCAAAAEISVDMQRAFRHAYADFTARHGTVLFFEELLAEAGLDRDAVRAAVQPHAPLIRYGLLHLLPEDDSVVDPPPSLLRITATPRLVTFLLGGDAAEVDLPASIHVRAGDPPQVVMDSELEQRVERAIAWAGAERWGGRRVVFEGPEGAGRRALIHKHAGGVVSLDADALPEDPEQALVHLHLATCEARVRGLPLFVNGLDGLHARREVAKQAAVIFERLKRERGPLFVGVERTFNALDGMLSNEPGRVVPLELPFPNHALQRRIWSQYLPRGARLERSVSLADLAGRYNMTGGKIRAAMANAVTRASVREPGDVVVTGQELTASIRHQLAHRLGDLAKRVSTPFTRDDLVVPRRVIRHIEEILVFYRQRSKVLYQWGFDKKLAYGRGLSALFSGPPGTGKTMAAAVLARELGMEIFQVDLSQIIDKYIGETEKKMARIFDEAGRGQAILLFDEADSVFAKRTEVRNSTDRYANVGVNFLLQRMESYDGITILTTNLESAIDEAFKRRIRFKVHFPMPDRAGREALWRTMIPPEALQDAELYFDELATEFELVGADIKNVVFKAASIAAEADEPISYELLRGCAKDIYRDRGKLVRDHGEEGEEVEADAEYGED